MHMGMHMAMDIDLGLDMDTDTGHRIMSGINCQHFLCCVAVSPGIDPGYSRLLQSK